MSDPEGGADQLEAQAGLKKRRFADIRPLTESPAFARLWIGSVVQGVGAQLTIVAVGLQIYDLTQSTFLVGLVGTVSLIPMIIAGLWGGVLADHFDRRRVLIISSLVGWASTLGLIAVAWIDATLPTGAHVQVWPLYVLTTVNAVAATIAGTTRAAVTPRILPMHLVPPAAALNGISFGAQISVGPALAGLLVAYVGIPWTYTADALLFLAGFAGIWTLPPLAAAVAERTSVWESLRQGASFLRRAPNIRAGFIVDLVAMTFGRPNVVFPAIGAIAIGGGAITVGVLSAAAAVGTFLTSLFSGPVGGVRHHGRAIGGAVMVYGVFIALFGLVVALMTTGWFGPVGPDISQVNWVALAFASLALLGSGASDEVSAIFRQSMLLTAAPDEMRGRLQGIFTVVVTGGPRLGDLYSGILATWVALWFPSALGGLVIIAMVAALLRLQPTLRSYDALHPTP